MIGYAVIWVCFHSHLPMTSHGCRHGCIVMCLCNASHPMCRCNRVTSRATSCMRQTAGMHWYALMLYLRWHMLYLLCGLLQTCEQGSKITLHIGICARETRERRERRERREGRERREATGLLADTPAYTQHTPNTHPTHAPTHAPRIIASYVSYASTKASCRTK